MLVIVVVFVNAAGYADRVCDGIRAWNSAPRWLPVFWIVPAVPVVVVSLVAEFNEITKRGQWGEMLFTMVVVGGIFGLAVMGVLKLNELYRQSH